MAEYIPTDLERRALDREGSLPVSRIDQEFSLLARLMSLYFSEERFIKLKIQSRLKKLKQNHHKVLRARILVTDELRSISKDMLLEPEIAATAWAAWNKNYDEIKAGPMGSAAWLEFSPQTQRIRSEIGTSVEFLRSNAQEALTSTVIEPLIGVELILEDCEELKKLIITSMKRIKSEMGVPKTGVNLTLHGLAANREILAFFKRRILHLPIDDETYWGPFLAQNVSRSEIPKARRRASLAATKVKRLLEGIQREIVDAGTRERARGELVVILS